MTQGTAAIPLAGVPLPNPIPDPAAGLAKLSTTVGRGAGRVPVLGRLAGWLATAASSKPPLAIVPATLAAHLAEVDRGRLVFDKQLSIFALAPTENTYLKARVYASTLDVIPEVDDHLREALHYNTYSSKTRVKEMRKYSATLDALVRTVLTAVLVFGTFTTLFVFGDVTSRKRGAIGIMRIMGMPPSGVFGIVLVRASGRGHERVCADDLAGYGLARLLALQYGEICKISTWHVEQVFAVVLACCLAGVLAPAWRHGSTRPRRRDFAGEDPITTPNTLLDMVVYRRSVMPRRLTLGRALNIIATAAFAWIAVNAGPQAMAQQENKTTGVTADEIERHLERAINELTIAKKMSATSAR